MWGKSAMVPRCHSRIPTNLTSDASTPDNQHREPASLVNYRRNILRHCANLEIIAVKKVETVTAGKWSKKFSAELNTDVCDRYNNAEITINSKIQLIKGDPSGGANAGTQNDAGGNSQNIIKWNDAAWTIWKAKFVKASTAYSGKFWLVNNDKWGEFEDKRVKYFPNIWCRHGIELVNSAINAHHTITVYRVPASGRGFQSDFSTMDSYDTELQNKKQDSRHRWIKQRPAVHEYFHTLGVVHIDHGEANCPAADSGNEASCYGDTDADRRTLMGAGMNLHARFADPWRRAAIKLTGIGTVASATAWTAMLRQHYPRTETEADHNVAVLVRPKRK